MADDAHVALVGKKTAAIMALEAAKQDGKPKVIRSLASQAYALESQVGQSFLKQGRPRDYAISLVSAASLLADANRKEESQRLFRLALQHDVPASLKSWIFAQIDPDIINPGRVFSQVQASIEGNLKLRRPQREAYEEVRNFFRSGKRERALVQLPVGCGKTGAMSILPFGISHGRTLVIAPNVEIAQNLYKNFDFANPNSFWRKADVLPTGPGPTAAYLDADAVLQDCDRSDFVIANIQQLAARNAEKWLSNYAPDYFDLILVDEVHHSAADTWQGTLARFPTAKVVGFTATPLRSDGKEIEGERVYRFPIASAIKEGFVKDMASVKIEPEEIFFEDAEGKKRHTLDEVLRLREEAWFSKGIALSRACNVSIVDESIRRVEELRRGGRVRHQIIGAACSVDHAKAIRSLYAERGYEAAVIFSQMPDTEKASVRLGITSGKLDAVVQVAMLGEGADYPSLSVAAVFRPFRHVVPYIQFIGRVMRVTMQDSPGDPDNRGYVVSHVGLHVERWWEELRKFDSDDEGVLEAIASGDRDFSEGGGDGHDGRRRYAPAINVLEEIIRRVRTERFLPEDARLMVDEVIAMLGERGLSLEVLGISRDDLANRLISVGPTIESAADRIQVQPQRERVEARKRLDERVRSAAKEVLTELGLSPGGRDLFRAFPGSQHNLAAAIILLNKAVNQELGLLSNDREAVSPEDARRVHDSMDRLVDDVVRLIRSKIPG